MDRQYLFWRWLAKNPLSRLAIENLPRSLARRILHGTDRRLASTNFEHKVAVPEEAILTWARSRLAEGWDTLLLGHYHEARSWELDSGDVRIFPAWYDTRRLEWL